MKKKEAQFIFLGELKKCLQISFGRVKNEKKKSFR